MATQYSQSLMEYDKMLKATMKRLGVEERDFVYDRDLRNGGIVQFTFAGRTWQYERTKDGMQKQGVYLKDGKEAWAQLVLGLRDLVRLHERKVFDFTAGAVLGLKELPPPIPACFLIMDFYTMPTSIEEVDKRFRELSKYRHPDILKDGGYAFKELKQAYEEAKAWMEAKYETR